MKYLSYLCKLSCVMLVLTTYALTSAHGINEDVSRKISLEINSVTEIVTEIRFKPEVT